MNKNKYGVKTSPQDYYKSVVKPSVSQNQSPIDTPVTYIDDEDVTNYYQGAYGEQYQPKPEAKPLKWYDFIPTVMQTKLLKKMLNGTDGLPIMEQAAVKLGMETKASSYGGESLLLQEENQRIDFAQDYIKKNQEKEKLQQQLLDPNTDKERIPELYKQFNELDGYLKDNKDMFQRTLVSTQDIIKYDKDKVTDTTPLLNFFRNLKDAVVSKFGGEDPNDEEYRKTQVPAQFDSTYKAFKFINFFRGQPTTFPEQFKDMEFWDQNGKIHLPEKQFREQKEAYTSKLYKNALINQNQTIAALQKKRDENDEHIEYNVNARQNIIDNLQKGTWYYNPTLITPAVQKKIDSNKISWNPVSWYWAVPQIGSSYSEVLATTGQVAAGVLTKHALGSSIGNPLATGVIMAGEIATDLALTAYSRQKESASEVYDAYTSDIQKSLNNGKLTENDLLQVFTEARQKLLSQYMIDTKKLSAEEILENVAAYNIKTNNPAFEELRSRHLNGLRKLYDQNNALATSDILESTLWSATGGQATKWIKRRIEDLAKQSFEKVVTKFGGHISSTIDKAVDYEAGKIVEGTAKRINPYKKIRKLRINGAIKDTAKKLGLLAIGEGTEEGQQWFMQDEYSRIKESDDKYLKENDSVDYLKSLYDCVDYGLESNLALLGCHTNDYYNRNEDLVNSYLVGSLVSLLSPMGAGPHVASMYDLKNQLKSDKYALDLINNSINDKDDYQAINQTVSVLNKNNQRHAYDSFDFIRRKLSKIVNNDQFGTIHTKDVDEVEKRFNTVYGMYKNVNIRQMAKSLNIKQEDEDFATIVGNAYKNNKAYMQHLDNSKKTEEQEKAAIEELKKSEEVTKLIDKYYENYLNEQKLKNNVKKLFRIIKESSELTKEELEKKHKEEAKTYTAIPEEFNVLSREQYGENMYRTIEYAARVQAAVELQKQLKHKQSILEGISKKLNLNLDWDNMNRIKKDLADSIDRYKKADKNPEIFNQLLGTNLSEIGEKRARQLKTTIASRLITNSLLGTAIRYQNAYVNGIFTDYNVKQDIMDKPHNRFANKTQEEREELRRQYEDKYGRKFSNIQVQNQYYKDLYEEYKIDDKDKDGKVDARKAAINIIKDDIKRYKQKLQKDILQNQKESEELLNQYDNNTSDNTTNVNETEEERIERENTQTNPTPAPATPNPAFTEQPTVVTEDQVSDKDKKDSKKPDSTKPKPKQADKKGEADDIYNEDTTQQDSEGISEQDSQNFLDGLFNNYYTTELNQEQQGIETNNNQQNQEEDHSDITKDKETQDTESQTHTEEEVLADREKKPYVADETEVTQNSDITVEHGKVAIRGKEVKDQNDLKNSTIQEVNGDIDNLNESLANSDNPVVEGLESSTQVKKSGRTQKTLFYNANSTEPMKPTFKVPAGVKIRSGKELSDFLADSKTDLSKCNLFYVVDRYNNAKFDINDPKTYDSASIYVVIQNGNDWYMASMKTVQGAKDLYGTITGQHQIISPAFTQKQKEDISALTIVRNRIISDYKSRCPFTIDKEGKKVYSLPDHAITDIKPTKVTSSMGSFNTQRDSQGNPVFSSLRDLQEAGIGNQVITNNVLTNTFILGYGTGDRADDTRIIKNLINGDFMPGSDKHIGYAGKIFLYPLATNNPLNRNDIPIVLSEKRFNNDNGQKDEITTVQGEERYRNVKPTHKDYSKGLPQSFLMYVLELITGQRNDTYGIISLIINQGMPTLLKKDVANLLPYLKLKQLAYDASTQTLITGYKDRETGKISTLNIKFNSGGVSITNENGGTINGQSKDLVLKAVMQNIRENFHWNTDKNAMTLPVTMKPSYESRQQKEDLSYDYVQSDLVGDLIDLYNTTGQTKLVFFPGYLEFTAEDLGLVIKDGKMVRNWDSNDTDNIPTYANWMINHQVLQTDLGSKAFKNGWIFTEYEPSTGNTNPPVKDNTVTPSSTITPTNIPVENTGKPAKANSEAQLVSSSSKDTSPAQGQDTSKKDQKAETKPVQAQEQATSDEEKKILAEIEEYKRNGIYKLNRLLRGKTVKVVVLNEEQAKKYIKEYTNNAIKYREDNIYYINLNIPIKSGRPNVCFADASSFNEVYNKIINDSSEVFSQHKPEEGEKLINIPKAKQWLKQSLGLTDEQMYTTDAILKSCSGKDAYGIMSWCMDTLRGKVSLSGKAVEGTEYHEAFHFVNLLLHDEKQRQILYRLFREQNPTYAKATDEEVEELLAEDYRRWQNKFSHKARYIFSKGNWFKHFSELINLWFLKKDTINNIYKNISKGKYKNIQVDQASLSRFKNKYNNEAMLSIPGINKANLDLVDEIKDPDTYYRICDTLTSIVIQNSNIRTQNDLDKLGYTQYILDNIENSLDNGLIDQENEELVSQVLDNFNEVFQKQVINNLADLSIRLINDKELEQQLNESVDTGVITADLLFDKASYEISKKVNATFNAKLFFYSIPDSEYVKTKDDEGNVIRTLRIKKDPIFKQPVCVPFNEAWNQIMENLWNIESYDDLLNKTSQLAKVNPFFAQLYKRFSDPSLGESVQTQLLTTIKSTKNVFNTLVFEPAYAKNNAALSGMAELTDMDVNFKKVVGQQWSIQSSNALRMQNRYSKTWSANFLLTDLVNKNSIDKYYVDKQKVDEVNKSFKHLVDQANNINKHPELITENPSIIDDLKSDVVGFLNSVGIDIDTVILDYYLQSSYRNNPKATFTSTITTNNFHLLYSFLNGKRNGSESVIKTNILRNIEGSNKYGNEQKRLSSMWSIGNKFIKELSIAKGTVYPSASEFSMIGPNGSLIYPISQNNYVSDVIRWLNKNTEEADKIAGNKYSAHSKIADASKKGMLLQLCNFLALKDGSTKNSHDSRGYFGINSIEDYISKLVLTESDNLLFPTMGDKPTWYTIKGMLLFHDMLAFDENGNPHFSQQIIDTFKNYFIDEFESIKEYNQSIPDIEAHPEKAVKNFHGKIKNGKMDRAGGNGGYFRYFHDIKITRPDGTSEIIQLDQALYNAYKSNSQKEIDAVFDIINNLINSPGLIDRAIEDILLDRVDYELKKLTKDKVISVTEEGKYYNKLLPKNLVSKYVDKQSMSTDDLNVKYSKAIYSLIANHTVNSMMSVKEVEMAFTGDPAYFKWTRLSKNSRLDDVADNLIKLGVIKNKEDANRIIVESSLDKIKRLSSVLSTGDNLRLQWDKGNPYNDKQTFNVLGLNDNIVKSSQYDYILDRFIEQVRIKYKNLGKEVTEKQITEEAETMAAPYKKINQTDAVVYVSPEMYQHIKRALGEWSDEIAKAYEILESDDALEKLGSNEPWVNESINDIIKPLKMVYFGIHNEGNQRIPIFDKMAIYPLFKAVATGNNRALYDRMNDTSNNGLNKIDMVTFDSAVKVGQRQTYDYFNSTVDGTPTTEEQVVNPLFLKNDKGVYQNQITTYKQLFKFLRLQLNTESHEDTERSLGSQAVKIGLSNVVKTAVYGKNKGKEITGQELLNRIFECINTLSNNGTIQFAKRYGKSEDNTNSKFYKSLIKDVTNSSIDDDEKQAILECIRTGDITPLQAFSSRNAFESKLIASLGRLAVDIKTAGGSAIQNSNFGWSLGKVKAFSQFGSKFAYNGGRKLTFINTDKNCAGTMDVILSINFFRHMVPKEYQTDFNTMRNWLLDHNIIGSKDGVKSESTGFVYRIPTQGLSSMPSIRVADVVPSSMGDVIVVPDEFTAMTGSDFDVDKLYICTYYYDQNGKKIEYDDSIPADQNSKQQLTNRLLDCYNILLSDDSNLEQTKGSIDTTTGSLKENVLPYLQEVSGNEVNSLYELSPSYQSMKKNDYMGGKGGVAPMARATTNIALAQSVGLRLKLGELGTRYGLNDTDAIYGSDNLVILDWFSAMINAHVDMAKDPYIVDMNVNKATWTMTEFLLRCGKGSATFYFLPQAILKEYAKEVNELEGSYGIDNTVSKYEKTRVIVDKLVSKYMRLMENEAVTDKQKQLIGIIKKYMSGKSTTNEEKALLNRESLMTEENLKKNLSKNQLNNRDFEYYRDQLLMLDCFNQLSVKANILGELVNCSQIDTKKYGNTVPQLKNYYLKVHNFINKYSKAFRIEGTNEEDVNALQYYFANTFLNTKLDNVVGTISATLRQQNINATDKFTNILNYVLSNLLTSEKNGDGDEYTYKALSDKDVIKRINQNLERMLAAQFLPQQYRYTKEELYKTLFQGTTYRTMANRLAMFKSILKRKDSIDKYPGLVDAQGNITNRLLKDLYPESVDEKDPINAINKVKLLRGVQDNDKNTVVKYKVYLQQLLEYPDPVVSNFAKDLIKYFFLTSNDSGGLNNLFKLVSMNYRKSSNYVDSIKQVVDSLNSGTLEGLVSDIDSPEHGEYPSILINLARNTWYDTNNVTNIESDEIYKQRNGVFKNSIDGKYMLYFTSYKHSDTKFITVNNRGVTTLYMNIGTVAYINKDKKAVKGTSNSIFVAIPKLGDAEPEDGTYIYEYNKQYNENSDFDFNDLPERMTSDEIMKDITNRYKPSGTKENLNDCKLTFIMNGLLSSMQIGDYTKSYLTKAQEPKATLEDDFTEDNSKTKLNTLISDSNNMMENINTKETTQSTEQPDKSLNKQADKATTEQPIVDDEDGDISLDAIGLASGDESLLSKQIDMDEPLTSNFSDSTEKEIKGTLGVDKNKLINLLGSKMYKANVQDTVEKETIQNSFDAVKQAKHKGLIQKGNIIISRDSKERTITVEDNGIGMTPEIVQKAFFTIGGSDKGDVSNELKSGGLGLAKMAFLFSAENIKLKTVRDGVMTTVDTNPEEIKNDSFIIKTKPTTESNGTTIEVKIPESYTNENGEERSIYFNTWGNGFLKEPLIGDTDITLINDGKVTVKKDASKVPDGYVSVGTAHSDFGDIDIYVNPIKSKYSNYGKILISGLFQFEKRFGIKEGVQHSFILNIKPSVGTTSSIYPINNTREGFNVSVDPEINDLNTFISVLDKKLQAADIAKTFGSAFSMEVTSNNTYENKNDKDYTKLVREALDQMAEENKENRNITQQENKEGDNVLNIDITTKSNTVEGKRRTSSLIAPNVKIYDKEGSVNTSKLDINKPVFHNNTTFSPDERTVKLLKSIGATMIDLKKMFQDFYKNNDAYSSIIERIQDQYWGISLDKDYGGVNVNPKLFNFLSINPFYISGKQLDALSSGNLTYAVTEYLQHLIFHEFNHNYESGEGAAFTGRFPLTYAEFVSIPGFYTWKQNLLKLVEQNIETIIKSSKQYEQSRNVGDSLTGNRLGSTGLESKNVAGENSSNNSDVERSENSTNQADVQEVRGRIRELARESSVTDESQSSTTDDILIESNKGGEYEQINGRKAHEGC